MLPASNKNNRVNFPFPQMTHLRPRLHGIASLLTVSIHSTLKKKLATKAESTKRNFVFNFNFYTENTGSRLHTKPNSLVCYEFHEFSGDLPIAYCLLPRISRIPRIFRTRCFLLLALSLLPRIAKSLHYLFIELVA